MLIHLIIFKLIVVEKNLRTKSIVDYIFWWQTEYLHPHFYLLCLILTWKQLKSNCKLRNNTTKWPHINLFPITFIMFMSSMVTSTKSYFWSSVISALYIIVYLFTFKASTSKINQFYWRQTLFANHNIFRLDITMYNIIFLQKTESTQQLDSEFMDKRKRETNITSFIR